ncbi:hypothetical protein MesoLj131a_03000 [Mesorhizobium sp. 131-2-1]|nr:hypothetical protein MesoLj131a_03000 [Mesorhizobium sp. 131-2-1]
MFEERSQIGTVDPWWEERDVSARQGQKHHPVAGANHSTLGDYDIAPDQIRPRHHEFKRVYRRDILGYGSRGDER